MSRKLLITLSKILLIIIFIYLFLVSIALMGTGFKILGKGFAENLIKATTNPFIGLFIGILATSIVQSSSTTTSIVVGMVGFNVITVSNAIPIIMGANIGTTVTNTIVALGHVTRREEFKRAITGATIHDFFNIICVCIMLPLQITTGFLEKAASKLSFLFANIGGIKFTSPAKLATKPAVDFVKEFVTGFNFSQNIVCSLLLIISLVLLFVSLYFIVRLAKSVIIKRVEIVLNNVIGKHVVLGIIASFIFTAIVQSSSITTSLMVPLVASGILTVETIFPIIMGANIGTTITAILASFATGNIAAITVAFVHFLFNVIGVSIIYPLKPLRKLTIALATGIGNIALKKRRYALMYTFSVFFLIPGIFVLISRLLK